MAEIAKLVDVFSSGDDLSQRLRADSSLNLGFRKLCSILRQAVEPVAGDGNKLGLQFWDQSQIQAVTSLALALVNSTRSLSVERVEPVIVAAIQLSVEFALCYLEKWICNSDDSMLQSYILQLLEIALVDETDKELDLLQPCSSNASMDMLPIAVIEDNCSKWQGGTRCMLQGGRCSKEEKAADSLLMTLASEWMHPDNVNTTTLRQSVPYDCNKLINVSQHWAVVHLECVHRLVTICKDLLRLPAPSDEKSAIPNLKKRFSFCVKVFKLLGSLTKNSSYTHFDAKLFRSVASFTEVLPTLFKLPFDFVSGYPAVESGLDSQVMLLLEEFIQIVQTIFCNTNVFQNIQACIAALILDHLDPDVWKYSSAVNPRPPLAYCPRVVVYVLKLILDVRNRTYQLFEYKGLDVEGVSTSQLLEPPLCQVHSAKVNLLKKYSVEELLRIIFSPSVQWVDNVMQLLLFLHSEGVKLKPKLERSCSSVTKTSVTSESENTACHEDEALFGDLFSEGGRSAGSVDGYDQPAVAHSSNTSSTPIQAATELLSFLNDCILSPEWCGPVYEDGCRKFTSYHIDILLSVLSSEGCDAEATGHDAGIALNEQMKLGYRHLSEICLDLFHNLLSRHALSDRVEETLVEKILVIENGAFLYNDLTLGLLAHAVVCLVDSAGSSLRTKMYNIFADFVCEKAKTICSKCPNLDELLGILPSLFHVEILLMAFHLSSEDEKAVQANVVFSALKAVAVPSAGFDSTQLSCWALLVSRLIVMLRHMLFYPLVCPSSLLLEFRTKLREASSSRLRPRVSGSRASSWVSILFEGVMGGFIKETPTCNALLSHLIDITPLPPSACRDDPTIECLGLSWNDICASFSRILRFWEGKKPEKVEDLILERYIFVLCWDLPVVKSTSEHLHRWLTSAEVPELSNAEHFVYFSQLFSGDMGKINYSHLSVMLMDLIHRLHDLHVSEDVGEFGWDFLRAGSWLSLSLSLVTAGTAGHCMDKALASAVPMLPEQTSRDGKFYAFTEGVISTLVGTNQVERLIRVLSSLLKRYLQVYQKALIMTIDGDQFSPNRLSPAMSFVHAGFDKCKQDELLEKMGSDPCQYKPLYGTLSRLDTALDKLSLGSHSKILWESLLHGFPCLLQPPSGTLLSSILNVAGVVNCIDGLMKVIDAGGVLYLETQAISQILELVCRIKCDSIFEDLHGKCNAIYQRLTEGSGGVDYSSLFVLKHMEEFLRCVNERDGGDTSGIYEALIVKVIDIVDSLKREPSGTGVLKYFLSLEDGSKQIKDLYGSQRGDLLVLVDALDGCNSEQVSIRVLNFFVDLLSGDMYAHVKEKLQKKFLHMDMVYLSKWLETRLLGSVTEESSGVACATGASVSLRESTMNFITCLLSPSSGILSQELHKHLVKSMLISLDKAFLLFEFTVAKCYFNFLVQLSGGENLIKQLMRQTMLLTEKLADDENLLQGLKYLFGFFASVLSDCCSAKSATERSLVKSIPSSSSAVGSAPTRSICSRKNADAVVLSSSQGASAIECDATSVDEDEDDGTSDGENGSLDKDEEEDNNSERALASKVCTFTSSGSNFMEQHWYFCYTCDLTVSKGCCSVCAKVCHRGHRVVYSRSSRFFCDCGAGGVRGSNCQCLKPRKFAGSNNAASRGASNFQSFLPFTENGDQLPDSDSDIDEDVLVEADNSIKMSIPKDLQDGMPILLDELDLESCVVRLCSSLLPSITSRRDSSLSRERKIFLGNEKVLCNSVDLLQLKKAYKSGSLDLKIKADYSNAKELKSHLASGSLVKSLLSVSTRGRLAVGEGDKVAIFDVGQLIGQATVAPVTADKTNVKPLSKNVVRFEIVNLIFNPLVENYLAVAGYEDCQVLTVNHRGEVSDRLAIELALQGAYIKHVDWVPGSQVQLMVVTNKFVKIYDLSLDNISPVHYFTLPDGMIMDAALIVASQGRMFLIVLSEHGSLYRLELSTKGNVGAKPLKEIMQIEGKERHAKGSSLYFSSMHRLLFLSLQDGTTLVGRVNPDATSLTEVSAILENETDSKHRPAGLHRWRDLFGGSALFVSFSSLNSNAACAVSFGEHQVLVQNLRHSVGSASPVVGVATYKPLSKDKIHCLVLHEDGSLQIYSHVPAGVDSGVSAISDKVKKLGPGILNNKAYGGAKPEFPLDFFEKTVCITQDVKLSSDAIRNGDSELAKQTLASEDGFLESPNPGGFKITVSNSNPDLVMVGLRLHVGNTSANHIPSEITVFQRVIKLDEGMRSWYDIAFTVAESLLADEEFTVSVGPTFSGAALPRIDSLEIYGRAKDEFGWKEKMDAVLDMEARVLGCNSWPAGSRRKCRATQSAPLQELVVAAGLKLLSRIYSLCKPKGCSKVEEAKVELSKLRCKPLLEVIFESDREPLLQAAANRVLQAVFPKREIYYQVKDAMRLAGVVKSTAMLSSKLGVDGTAAGWIIEEFTAQMRVVSKIALHRRSNLASFLEMNGSEVVDGLMHVLWGILDIEQPDTQTMNNIVVSSVELIYCYAECLALHGKDGGRSSVAPAVSLFKKLLFSTNEAVQTSSSLAISSRFLQVPFPKQTMIGTDDVENPSCVPTRVDASAGASGSTQVMVEEDSITSSVQYCCDGCSTVPILRRRWHCTVCPDFDLCEACYEVLDADRLAPPHSRDHPMTAIPIEVETFGGEGSEIHFSTDDLSDPGLLTVASDVGVQNSAPSIHELEPNESEEFSPSILDPVTISASKRAVNSLLLSELLEQLKGWMETTSGTGAIPVMQLFYRLSSAVGGPFADSSEPESIGLENLIKWFLDEINLNKPFVARSRTPFGEVTILVLMFFTLMLRNWHQPGTDGSATKSGGVTEAHDKAALHISPSTCVAASPTLDGQEKIDFISHLLRACSYLRQQAFVNYLMNILQELTQVFKSPPISTDASSGLNTASGCGALLTIRREVPAGNFSPFFSDSYAKSHRADIFVDYHRLLLENTFRLLYSLIRPEKHDKAGEKEKIHKMISGKDLKLDGYQDVLCSYINNPNTSYVRRYARRLFLHLCGSKTHYYSVRDSWQFSTEVKKLYKHINKSGGFQSSISYERSVKIVRCLTTMAEVAAARPRNWQKYCLRHGDLLPFLLNGIFYFGEECVIQALKLLNLAFYTGKDSTHSSQKAEVAEAGTTVSKLGSQAPEYKKKKKGEDSESGVEKTQLDMEAVVDVFIGKGGDVLKQFIDCFLLEWNSSSVRSESKSVLLGVWHHGNPVFRETLLTALLEKVKSLPMYGQNIIEYTELVTFLLGKVPDHGAKLQSAEVVDKCLTADVINCIFETLHSQNELLANHPNSRIYNTLSGLVEFDGYYLESEPCVACSSPEVPYSRMKLESLKSETKFTDNRIIVKCTGSYTIQSVAMNVHDARKSKSVKVLNLYYNNRPVADLSELKNNWSLWKRAKSCHLAFNQTELKVDFAIPITACNFMIELDSFYENLQALSLEPLQCPRCSRAVTDKHGICSNCHENAYQCRQCRNINYENLDSFLCNECGYSKYGRFEFNFMAKPSFTFDSMENEEDMKRGLTAIEAESENAHRRYQQLLGFKKPLLKIVSSVGENEMDSQQKDSVQQMMVSLPGPSCKINRKIALLGVLYGEKCKAAFDSVSKSVQTLQGLRRVLMNYLHQKQSDNVGPASRFVVSRVPNSCYGCASTFVTQCLEILQVLSKNPASKKQLVAAGVLSELFENNIHQGPKTARVQARGALCAFSEGDTNAVAELNSLIHKKVMYCLEHHRSMDIALATREELSLLSDVCSLSDEFWESRLRVVFQLLFASIKVGAKHPAISEHVILPCLRIISQACTPPKPDGVDKEQGAGKSSHVTQVKDDSSNVSGSNSLVSGSKSMSESSEKSWNGSQKAQDIQLLSYSEWEKGASYLDFVRRQYKVSQAGKSGQRSRLQRQDYLALKYLLKWKRRVSKTARNEISSFELGSWVTELILSACSQSIRSEMCMLISLLCGQSSSRQFRLLNLLMSLLSATLAAGENAAEYFELLFKMIDTEDARLFLTVRSCLTTICKLITQELVNVEKLERSLHVDISQGFILHKLIELLGKFLEVPSIRSRFMREHLLSEVLEALIVIRGLVVQKTKLINDCNRLLKDLLDSLLLESNENKRQFIQACISGLQIHGDENRGRTSLQFILEQLCNLISPSKPEPVYLLILNKAHTQEEFIRGSMTKNPYSSAEIGPLMRDVKNKICQQLDLLGLIEDDYGMELLVAGNIISLDLSIAQVFEQVWKKSSSQSASVVAAATSLSSSAAVSGRDCPPMTVTYRLQGLDGEATEPMIKEIDEDREETQDPEVEFAIAGAVRECGGLEILLGMVQRLQDDFKSNQEQLVAVLNLLMLCCKIRENRKALLKLGALGLLLETARRAFFVDAMEPAEGILLIVESLTLEANESDNISITPGVNVVSSDEAGAGEQAKKIVLLFLERLSHPSGLKKSNKQQRNTEMVARILPYLTYGEPAAMEALVQHFEPCLQNWCEFDRLQKLYEDNMKDETIAQQASKQKYTLENFVRVSESLKTSSCGERLKDIILEKGITGAAVSHLKECFAFTGQAGFKSTVEWASGLKLPSIPLILSMLRGLSMGHLATQKCIDEGGILPLLHALEGVSGENEIGARAENLLDTLSDKEGKGDGFLAEKVHQLRHATRDEMRRRALRKRTELLQGLGMRQELSPDGGERIVVARPVLKGLEDVEDEDEEGLACMVCREGYRLRPTDLLGVYTYSKRVNLGIGSSGNARGDCVYTTVSHFNIIHFQCHQEAKRADAALKNPKKEWDGAALRNNETLCNNLFPVRGPSVPMGQYIRYVDQYWDYLNALGRADGSRLRLLTYDIVLMLARFATGASFSADCRGGGKESNARFLPFMMQMARHLLDHDSSQRHIMIKSISTYLSSPASESRASTTAGTQTSAGTEETVQFMMVTSLLSESYESWLQHRSSFLQRGIYHAYIQRTHGRPVPRSSRNLSGALKPESGSTSASASEAGGSVELFSTIHPMLVYTGLIEQMQRFFKVKKLSSVTILRTQGTSKNVEEDDESRKLEGWEVVMKDRFLNVKEMADFSSKLLSWLDGMTSATNFQEAFDILGVLGDVLSGFSRCEDYVHAAISGGKN
ncbi:auxin transport protein BIG isoform X1 [Nicotiana sylvestris]|uniref:Auxin transport protein BIG n=1 Tax=Nicotiana sylvestris TaxID=4096 RepID=A0A1U7X4R9_NICSY|nr:PREDICTED: auxin transport protein BIG isoform X1 [Nicotiana sylvestris]